MAIHDLETFERGLARDVVPLELHAERPSCDSDAKVRQADAALDGVVKPPVQEAIVGGSVGDRRPRQGPSDHWLETGVVRLKMNSLQSRKTS